ncbi:DedA family protein [Sphingomonas faeni]|uniref:DedA family protein n=1 Tax=Sphingomonas faeni TaxID=185950 RepID=UPI00335D2BDE
MSIETLIAQYGLAAIFVGAGLEGETSVVTGGLLAHEGLLSLSGTALAAVVGSFAADQLFFFVGRRYRDTARVRRIAAKPAFAKALDTLDRHPTVFILSFRFLYGLRTISPIAIGTSHVPARTFVVLNAISAALWGVLFTGIGYLFGHSLIEAIDAVMPKHKLLGIVAIIALVALVMTTIRYWRRRRSNAARQPEAGERRSVESTDASNQT